MEKNKRILLYGNSLILGSIGTILRRCSQFEVTTLLPPLQEIQKLNSLKPGILLFDLDTTRLEAFFFLLGGNPNLHLIGISPGINLVKVCSNRELREVPMADLLEVIRSEAKDLPVKSGGNEVRISRR
jgi:hypothetical protein